MYLPNKFKIFILPKFIFQPPGCLSSGVEACLLSGVTDVSIRVLADGCSTNLNPCEVSWGEMVCFFIV